MLVGGNMCGGLGAKAEESRCTGRRGRKDIGCRSEQVASLEVMLGQLEVSLQSGEGFGARLSWVVGEEVLPP